MKAICWNFFQVTAVLFLIGFHFTFKICSFDLQTSVAELRLVDRKELVGVSASRHPSKYPQTPPLSVTTSGSRLARGSCLSLLPPCPIPLFPTPPTSYLPSHPLSTATHIFIHFLASLGVWAVPDCVPGPGGGHMSSTHGPCLEGEMIRVQHDRCRTERPVLHWSHQGA